MKATFIQADVFDSNTAALRDLNGKMDIIYACQFLHFFRWKKQCEVLRKVIDMSRFGACLVGNQVGWACPVEMDRHWGVLLYHKVDSFHELWRQVAKETGTRWALDVSLVELSQWGAEREDYDWMSADSRGLNFVVTRSDEGTGPSLS